MTREEAADILRHNYPADIYTDLRNAVDIAIKELAETTKQESEYFTDREQIIFLAAINREEKVCRDVDKELGMNYEDSLVRVCDRIRIKVKKALWS